MSSVRMLEVIETKLARRGDGKSMRDPIRGITQYWTREGDLLAEVDPFTGPTLNEQVEAVAEAIYDVMPGPNDKPKWLVGGNSIMQQEARKRARDALLKE